MAHAHAAGAPARTPAAAGRLLGFALGGFFDGILLHQVLQWHHLLSNVQALRDMRTQVLADGLFHALMYLLALAGLAVLWRRRAALAGAGAGQALSGAALMGFGAWHVVDAVVSHWVTGIHRIRGDAANPLLWDLAWFAVFGLVPLLAGWRMRRRAAQDGGDADGGGRGASGGAGTRAGAALGLLALLAGPLAAVPSPNPSGQTLVLFAPGVRAADAFAALARADARVLWVDRSGGLWAVRLDDTPAVRARLYRGGALLVSGGSAAALGCVAWSSARAL